MRMRNRETEEKHAPARVTIEFPSRGATYHRQQFGVYRLDTYPASSVLAGQQRRTFVDAYATLADARAAHPDAKVLPVGATSYRAPDLSHLPDDGDD